MVETGRFWFNSLERPFAPHEQVQQETDQWRSYLLANQVHFEGASEPFTSAPYVISSDAYLRMAQYLEPLSRLIEKCLTLYAACPEIQEFYGFAPRLRDLIVCQARQVPPAWYCRFDFVLSGAGIPRVMEVNGDCPAGLLQQYHYQLLCEESDLIRRGVGKAALRTELERADFVPSHIRAMRADRRSPIALLNSRHRTLRNEIDLYDATLNGAGIASRTGYVEDLRFRDRGLWLGDERVDVALTKFDVQRGQYDTPPVGASWADIADFEQAIHAQAILVLNSLAASVIAESKETLALLCCPRLQHHFSEAERALIEASILQTLRLDRVGADEFNDVLAEKDRWVLKRCIDTRGRSVVLGSEETNQSWSDRLTACRRENASEYVLQERAFAHTCRVSDAFPSLPQVVHTVFGGYVVRGKMAGLLVRSSRSLVTNVARQGFVQPHLIV